MNIRTDPVQTTGQALLDDNHKRIGVKVGAIGKGVQEPLSDRPDQSPGQPEMRHDGPLRLARTAGARSVEVSTMAAIRLSLQSWEDGEQAGPGDDQA